MVGPQFAFRLKFSKKKHHSTCEKKQTLFLEKQNLEKVYAILIWTNEDLHFPRVLYGL